MSDIINKFSLGPGRLYVAAGRLSEGEIEKSGILAGDTDGGCTLKYEYKTKELYDVCGNNAATLQYGERVTVKGRLGRICADAYPILLSGDRGTGGLGRMSALLVCPLPGGDSFRLYVIGGVPAGATFSASIGGGLDFEFTCGRKLTDPRFCLAGTVIPIGEGSTL